MLTPMEVSGRRTEAIRETAGRGLNAATNGSRSTIERCPSTATQVCRKFRVVFCERVRYRAVSDDRDFD